MKTSQIVVVGDEQHLGPPAGALDVRSDEPKDVLVPKDWDYDEKGKSWTSFKIFSSYLLSPHQDCLVYLGFSEPACLFCGEEHLKTAKMRIENEKGKAKEEKMTKKFVDQTLTATRSPLHLANQTSPYLGIDNQNKKGINNFCQYFN